MTHSLIVGMTESGKTTLAKRIAAQYKSNGVETIILDPMCDPEWESQYIFDEPDEFLDFVFKSRQCALFIDESGEVIGRYGGAMNKLARQSRHWGHKCHFLSQRAQDMDIATRNNCSQLYLFKSDIDDCALMAKKFAAPELKEAYKLSKGEFFYTNGFDGVIKNKIF